MNRPAAFAAASAILAVMVVVIWLGAPIVPAVVGAAAAGYLVYRRDRQHRG